MSLRPYSVEVWLLGAFPSDQALDSAIDKLHDAAEHAGFVWDGAQSLHLPDQLVQPGSLLAKRLEFE